MQGMCSGPAPDGIRHHPDLLVTTCNIEDYLHCIQHMLYGFCFPIVECGFYPAEPAECQNGYPACPPPYRTPSRTRGEGTRR